MNKFWLLNALAALLFSFNTYGQTFLFQGTVRESATNKTIENVVADLVPVNSQSTSSYTTVTNVRGMFSIECPAGTYRLTLRVLAHAPLVKELTINSDLQQDFLLSSQSVPLGEVEVSSLRVNRKIKELPIPLAVVESTSFQKRSALTLSNVLATEPGISMGSDGVWATSINIRGLGENRLVTLIDGNRIETATDLTASFSMIDVNDIERVELVKSAQSSLYGTGAIGGIVNIISKDGHFSSKPYFSGNVSSAFLSANKLFSNHASLSTGSEKWYVRLSGTYNNADDIRTPEGILPNSQFTSNNISAKAGFKPFANHLFKLQYQNNGASNVGIPGGSAFPGPAEASYTNISRQLLSASYEISDLSDKLSLLKLSYFTQYIQRDVSMVPNTVKIIPTPTGEKHVTPELITPIGNHLTHGTQLQSTWNLSEKNTLIAGVDVWSRKITTERTKNIKNEVLNTDGDIVKTINLVRGETPIPEATFSSSGIFIQDETHFLNDKLTLIVGGRMDVIGVKNSRGYDIDYLTVDGVRNDTPPNQRITFEEGSENALSWSANTGLLTKLSKDTDLSLSIARSFRAASLEERFKYIDLGNYVRLGDPDLAPESAYSADLGLRIWKPKFNFQINTFVNRISNMIIETPGEFIYTLNTGELQGTSDT
ncbi:MAG: TonB-dependent receptor, partial [Bacteroidales bacterium]|nr:TonB-dependent receptor [Bacteroidales bacterium]